MKDQHHYPFNIVIDRPSPTLLQLKYTYVIMNGFFKQFHVVFDPALDIDKLARDKWLYSMWQIVEATSFTFYALSNCFSVILLSNNT